MLFASIVGSPWILGAAHPIADDLTSLQKLGIAVGIVVVSWAGGMLLSQQFRMAQHAWRIGLVLFATLASSAIATIYWPPKLGIDLRGGAILVYEVDQSQKKDGKPVEMDKLISALGLRINPGGQKEIIIRQYGPEQVEIIVPDVDAEERQRLMDRISSIGTLEFRILADRRHDSDIITRAEALPEKASELKYKDEEGNELVEARWVPVAVDKDKNPSGNLPSDAIYRGVGVGDRRRTEVLVRIDRPEVTGDFLTATYPGFDRVGKPAVNFQFDAVGAERFGNLTGRNIGRYLGIVLDGHLYSAPVLNDRITDRGEITGSFTQAEVENQVAVLNAGKLPTTLNKEPISNTDIGATLGEDTIRMGTTSTIISIIAVIAFMIVYYRFAGLVAALALVLNIVMTVAVAMIIKAPFTLPGLAGLALTLGMAVDANVLIYERLREEMQRGSALRMAIRNGYDRAMTTIIDSNLTTLITSLILYAIGTDQVKGFAVMLTIGLLISMFTACFCSRVIFDIWERQQWMRTLTMMQAFKSTHFDFVSWMPKAIVLSTVIIVAGLAGVFARGKGLLNIDFTGGYQVEAIFKQATDIAEVRRKAESNPQVLPDVTVVDMSSSVEGKGKRFRIETANGNRQAVEDALAELFPDQLDSNTVLDKQIAMVAPEKAADDAAEAEVKPADPTGGAAPEGQPGENSPPASPPAGEGATEESGATEPSDGAAPGEGSPEGASESTTPAEGTPAEPAPADAEPASQPSSGDGSSVRPRRGVEVAAAGGAETLLTLLSLGQEAEGDAPANNQPASDQPVSDNADTPAAASEPAAGEEQPAAPAAEVTNSEDAAAVREAADAPAANEGGAAEKVAAIELKFREPMTHDTLQGYLRQASIKAGLAANAEAAPPMEITNPDYNAGSSAAYRQWTVKMPIPEEAAQKVVDSLEADLVAKPYFPSSSNIGGKVAGSTSQKAIFALLASCFGIAFYLWLRFENVVYGVAAVIALVHDVLVALAGLALSYWLANVLGFALVEQFKIDLSVVAALLTIIGFSVNDTVVIFDRLREVKGKSPRLTPGIINTAVNQTLSRTFLTSFTVFVTTIILYIWGGPSIHAFAFTFLVGVITGTYSTIFVAAPILLWFQKDEASNSNPRSGSLTRTA